MGEKEVAETEFYKMEIQNGVIWHTYKSGPVTLEIAKEIVRERLRISKNKTLPVLIQNGGLRSLNGEAREYLTTDEALVGLSASAIVAKNMFTQHIANFFVRINVIKPKIPTKIFSAEEEALKWLEEFK